LLSKDPENQITVLAKHMPGDYDIEYASPWAGANYMPYGQHALSVLRHLTEDIVYIGLVSKEAITMRGNEIPGQR
jgi:hypothetical protein